METQELFVEMTIRNENTSIMARCPDEDDEMSITIRNRYKVVFSLTIEQAKDLADFILAHVQNVKISNS